MADKKKKVQKPVIGYGANMGAGKKATKKVVKKVTKAVVKDAYKTVKPTSKSSQNQGKRTAEAYPKSKRISVKNAGKKVEMNYANAVALGSIKKGPYSQQTPVPSSVKQSVNYRKSFAKGFNAQLKKAKKGKAK